MNFYARYQSPSGKCIQATEGGYHNIISSYDLSEEAFGLLRNNVTENPAFRSVKHLISILSGKGPDFEPNSLNYVFNGSTNDIRQILFQKHNGDFYLVF